MLGCEAHSCGSRAAVMLAVGVASGGVGVLTSPQCSACAGAWVWCAAQRSLQVDLYEGLSGGRVSILGVEVYDARDARVFSCSVWQPDAHRLSLGEMGHAGPTAACSLIAAVHSSGCLRLRVLSLSVATIHGVHVPGCQGACLAAVVCHWRVCGESAHIVIV